MTKEERVKRILLNPNGIKLRDEYPEEVQVAVKSFLEASKMVVSEDLDHLPHEYLTNMLQVLIKYPETQEIAWDLVQILKKDGVI